MKMYKHFCYSVCFCQSFDTMAQFICLKTWQKSAPLHFLICCSLQFPTTISFWDLTSCFTGLSFTFIAYIESFYIIRNATQLCIAYLQSSEQYRFMKTQVNSYPGTLVYNIIIRNTCKLELTHNSGAPNFILNLMTIWNF